MSFPRSYREWKELARKTYLQARNARAIMRKGGFRPGASIEGSLGGPILSVCPSTSGRGCPRAPHGGFIDDFSPGERAAFYDTLERAQNEDPSAFEEMEDYLIAAGLEATIVMNGVMPLLTYDYAGEVYTLTINEGGACPIEVDIVPPFENGFWEQYKDGDTRFSDIGLPLAAAQDLRFLCKSVYLATGAATLTEPGTPVYLNTPNPPHYAGFAFTECTHPDTGDISTHYTDFIGLQDSERVYIVSGYRANYGPATIANKPFITVTNDRLLDNYVNPEWDLTHYGNGPFGGVIDGAWTTAAFTGGGFLTFTRNVIGIPFYADEAWRKCVDPPPGLEFNREHFCIMQSEQSRAPESSTRTFRGNRVIKEAPTGRRDINWAIDPPGGPDESIERYSQEWDLFDVVAVRMAGSGPSLPVGTHSYPVPPSTYGP